MNKRFERKRWLIIWTKHNEFFSLSNKNIFPMFRIIMRREFLKILHTNFIGSRVLSTWPKLFYAYNDFTLHLLKKLMIFRDKVCLNRCYKSFCRTSGESVENHKSKRLRSETREGRLIGSLHFPLCEKRCSNV